MIVSERGGPYLAAALLCQNVEWSEDRSHSVIQDILTHVTPVDTRGEPAVVSEGQGLPIWLFLWFYSGGYSGRQVLHLRLEDPAGRPILQRDESIPFKGGLDTTVGRFSLLVQARQEGTHWMLVRLGNQLIARLPLTVAYLAAEAARSGLN